MTKSLKTIKNVEFFEKNTAFFKHFQLQDIVCSGKCKKRQTKNKLVSDPQFVDLSRSPYF